MSGTVPEIIPGLIILNHSRLPACPLLMKSLLLSGAALTISLLLPACLNTEKEIGTTDKDPRATFTPPAASERSRMSSASVLNTVQASHVFSNPVQPDKFVLQLRGLRILTGQVHLMVLSAAGDTLRHEVLPARALLSEEALADPAASSSRDKEIAILKRMNTFFALDNFVQPAVPVTAEQPAEFSTAAWTALKADPSTVAFDCPGRDGGLRRLAYSKSMGKVLVISQ